MLGIVARHESASLFRSAQTWILAALLATLFGFQFLKQLEVFIQIQAQLASQDHPTGLSGFMTVRYLEPLALAFTFVCPLYAMRTFSEEFRQQTFVLWQSSPVSTLALVLGKFLGVMSVIGLLVLLAAGLLLSMWIFTPIDLFLWLSSTLGLFLCCSACTACGLYFSSLTQHSLVAIIASLAFLLISWMLGSASFGNLPLQALKELSIASHLRGFFQGYLQTRDIGFFALVTVLFLGLTVIRLDSLRQTGR